MPPALSCVPQSARESGSAAAKRTAEVFGKVGQQAQSSYSKALENERVSLHGRIVSLLLLPALKGSYQAFS